MNKSLTTVSVPDCDGLPSPTGAKTVLVIELLSQRPEGLSAPQVMRELGFTSNLVYRILRTLLELGWVYQREDSSAYTLTNRMLQLSGPQIGEESLTLAAYQPLRELRDVLGETVQLLIEVEGKMSVLEQFRGLRALQVCGQIGMRIPMYSCAPGKAMLAAWSEERLAEWFRTTGRALKKFTPRTVASKTALKEDFARIRVKGYATDWAEGLKGIHCVAVTVADNYRQPVGAITIVAPSNRLQEEDIPSFVEHLHRAKEQIESRIRH